MRSESRRKILSVVRANNLDDNYATCLLELESMIGQDWEYKGKVHRLKSLTFVTQNGQVIEVETNHQKILLAGKNDLFEFVRVCQPIAAPAPSSSSSVPQKATTGKVELVGSPDLFAADNPLAEFNLALREQLQSIQKNPTKANLQVADAVVKVTNSYVGLIKTAMKINKL